MKRATALAATVARFIALVSGSPVVRNPLVVQMPHPSNQWMMASRPGPLDSLMLRGGSCQCVVHMILDHIARDGAARRPPLRLGLNINVRQLCLPLSICS